MIHVQRGPNSVIRDGAFLIRRTRPGLILGPGGSGALGPLAVVDHAEIGSGTIIAMHEHRDDEILSYVGRGSLIHEDSAGNRMTLSSTRLMMMNAGAGLFHEETVPSDAVEMLQIFIRPHASALHGKVAFHDRREVPSSATWNQLAGPDGNGAPLTIRNDVAVLDSHLRTDDTIEASGDGSKVRWTYLFAGSVRVGDVILHKGDSFVPIGSEPVIIRSVEPSVLLGFIIGVEAPSVRSGTISGRD